MYLYFFDLDDTICDTKSVIDEICVKKDIKREDFPCNDSYYKCIEKEMDDEIALATPVLENSIVELLRRVLETNRDDIYYITARPEYLREISKKWLQKNNFWISEETLIVGTEGIKGKVMNGILEKHPDKIALFFDDLEDNHIEAKNYKRIISCVPY